MRRRHIGWMERDEQGRKREVRVLIEGRKLRWETKMSDEDVWNFNATPTPADWDTFLEKVDNLYRRRSASFDVLELVRALKAEADAKARESGADPGQTTNS